MRNVVALINSEGGGGGGILYVTSSSHHISSNTCNVILTRLKESKAMLAHRGDGPV